MWGSVFSTARLLTAATLLAALLPAAPATVAADRGSQPTKLLTWFDDVGEDGEEELYGDRIITDRPHLAEAASTVGLGRVQVENGYTYYLDGSGGATVRTHSFPETLVRVGLFQEWFEFRVQYNYLDELATGRSGTSSVQGSDDLYLGAKVALTAQSGILPEITIFPQMRVPTGSPRISGDEVLPGMNFVYAWRVTDRFEIEGNTNVNRRRNPGLDHYYTEYLQTFNFEYDLVEQIMLFNEFVIFAPSGAIGVPTQAYSHGGFHYFLLPNVQIDVHAAVGLNEAADDMFAGSGLSWRW
ncbi:MAG: transporter [Planctomycetia bacterium]